MIEESGADPAFVATPSSRQGVSTKGFNPGEWRRYRFRSWSTDDPRPVTFPPPGPYWVTGYGNTGLNGNEFATLVAYLPGNSADELEDFWPESDGSAWDGYDFQWRDEIAFTSRFPKPNWWDASAIVDTHPQGQDGETRLGS